MMVPEIIIGPANWARAGNLSGQHALESDFQRTWLTLGRFNALRQTTQPFVAETLDEVIMKYESKENSSRRRIKKRCRKAIIMTPRI